MHVANRARCHYHRRADASADQIEHRPRHILLAIKLLYYSAHGCFVRTFSCLTRGRIIIARAEQVRSNEQ